MRLSGLCLAALLILSSVAFAQHSSGSSGGSTSSGGGGGGSHGGSVSSGAGGGGGHSSGSGGSHVSGASAAHVSNSHDFHSSPASRLVGHESTSNSNNAHSNHQLNRTSQVRATPPEKRSFFGFLRHPFRKPEPNKSVADLRHRVCLTGPCQVCPNGQVASKDGCSGMSTTNQNLNYCFSGQAWGGNYCMTPTNFVDDCGGYRMAMEQQARIIDTAESARQNACASGSGEQCLEATNEWQSEKNLYRELQNRYQQCQMRSRNAFPFDGHSFFAYGSGLRFDPLRVELDH